ncbi:MAG: SIS domain-containing protein [Chloroflexi bacterium]|nr:SIS domain-containing protein [Chloroflexota bacterium]
MRMDKRELKWESMLAGITAQAGYLRDGSAQTLHAQTLDRPLRVPSRIYLVGCGDSHYAGLATQFAFERWSGIPTEALESLEFSRYAIHTAPPDALVVAVSNSGRVIRTVECARVAREHGIATLGLTYNPSSPLAVAADMLLSWTYEDVGFGPGTLSYLASLVGLYALAIRLGQLHGRLDEQQAAAQLDTITATGDMLQATVSANQAAASQVAGGLGDDALVCIVGGGPNYATALFGMAKFIEAAAYPAVGQELEEWAHEQYFCTRPGTTTFVVAPPGASVDRAREQLQAIRDVGGRGVAICDPADGETTRLADAILPIPWSGDELLSPLVTPVPLELVALGFARFSMAARWCCWAAPVGANCHIVDGLTASIAGLFAGAIGRQRSSEPGRHRLAKELIRMSTLACTVVVLVTPIEYLVEHQPLKMVERTQCPLTARDLVDGRPIQPAPLIGNRGPLDVRVHAVAFSHDRGARRQLCRTRPKSAR